MTDTRELTCINCPMGCRITVTMEVTRDGSGGAKDSTKNGTKAATSKDAQILSITGNTCKRGEIYARTEVTAPVRTVTTTIKVTGGTQDRVSCKTKEPVPKEKIFEVMDAINNTNAKAPIKTGDILIEDCAGTGIPVVATKAVEKA